MSRVFVPFYFPFPSFSFPFLFPPSDTSSHPYTRLFHPPMPKVLLAFAQGFMRNLENLARPRPLLELRTRGASGAVGASLVMGAESAVGSAFVSSADPVALFWFPQSRSHCSLLRSSVDFSALSSSICWTVFGVAFSNLRSIFSRRFILPNFLVTCLYDHRFVAPVA